MRQLQPLQEFQREEKAQEQMLQYLLLGAALELVSLVPAALPSQEQK